MTINEGVLGRKTERKAPSSNRVNVSAPERWASGLGGGFLLAYGASHRSWNRALLMTAGGGLLYRAVTGRCQLYKALGLDSTTKGKDGITSVRHGEGVKLEYAVTINRSPEELYRFWRNLENLPTFMKQLESVRVLTNGRSHWIVKTPVGKSVEWEAEIHNDLENHLIAWRSLPGADLDNAGSVHFRSLPDGRTEVRVVMSYEPPFGKFGLEVARLLGEDPSRQLQDDLWRFKQMMETGGPSDEIKQRSI